jgi:hypothetical protein
MAAHLQGDDRGANESERPVESFSEGARYTLAAGAEKPLVTLLGARENYARVLCPGDDGQNPCRPRSRSRPTGELCEATCP